MSSPQECLKKTYVKLRYIRPQYPHTPLQCEQVKFTKDPELRILTGQLSALEGRRPDEIIGIDLHCALPSTQGAGAIILLLQVSAYIEWEVEFMAQSAHTVRETHRVFVSIPMMYKLHGPRIALMALSPWKLKLASYTAQIAAAFRKIDELEKVMANVVALKKGFCPKDVAAMESALKAYETQLNQLLQGAAQGTVDGEIARKMDRSGYASGRFAGTRVA
jgi:hypothetical protein